MFGAFIDGLTSLVGAPAAGVILPAVAGAGIGALGSIASGGKPLAGALTGGITGGAIGGFGGEGGALAQALGLSGSQANALIGGLGGALGYGVTGQNPLIGGALGAGGGYLYGQTGMGSGDPTLGGAMKEPLPENGGPWYDPATGQIVQPAADAGAATGNGLSGGPLGKAAGAVAGGGAGAGSGVAGTGLSKTSMLMGVLSALASAASKPKQGNWPLPGASSNPNVGPLWNTPLNTSAPGRTAVNPYGTPPPSYWTYGGPEQNYFANNSLKSYGFAEGGLAQEGAPEREFSTGSGDHYVQGPGDGQSDDIPARLADGEYVFDASTVSRLGNGSNRRGAALLDAARRHIANDAGSKEVVQHQITKGPLEYFAHAGRAA